MLDVLVDKDRCRKARPAVDDAMAYRLQRVGSERGFELGEQRLKPWGDLGVARRRELERAQGLVPRAEHRALGRGRTGIDDEHPHAPIIAGRLRLLRRLPAREAASLARSRSHEASDPAGPASLAPAAEDVPALTEGTDELGRDPAWTVELPSDAPRLARVAEALGCLADGVVGTRASLEEDGPGANPLVLAAGVYDAGPGEIPRLLPLPTWTSLELRAGPPGRRLLDLRAGVLVRIAADTSGEAVRTVRFACLARPGVAVLVGEGPSASVSPGRPLAPLRAPGPGSRQETAHPGGAVAELVASRLGGGAAVAASQRVTSRGGRVRVERIAAYVPDPQRLPAPEEAVARLADARAAGVAGLLGEHRRAWAARWEHAAVDIPGDPATELGVRFGLFHLMASVADRGEAAVGARGLSGPAYAGHVFWDADVFVLPFLAATHPGAARAMLEYRLRRLPAARDEARRRGFAGARFPWESANEGRDVTPRSGVDPAGRTVEIRTGEEEEHIGADVAWAAVHYAAWSGDEAFLSGDGAALVMEIARYFASRAERDPDASAHLRGVIGPDEYHEHVDDDAFTNLMVRSTLRHAAQLAERTGRAPAAEAASWRELADALVDHYDERTGLYEQFEGFYDLEPLVITEIAAPPVAADLLLGKERVAGSQVLKQADVLMAHHLLPDEVAPGSLEPNLAYYLPRTAHGSSLSPAIHASLLARAGRPDEALDLFRMATRLDLEDLTGTTAGGVHLATMGGVWQALAYGFCGLWPLSDALRVDPRLPGRFDEIGIRVRFRGSPLELRVRPDEVEVACTAPVRLALGPGRRVELRPPGGRVRVGGGTRR
jgi:trehalose/maltose hydrolase-like predicted phosphorylase